MDINYISVLVSAIASFAVGGLWYGPIFGKPWRSLMGIPEGMMSLPGARLSPSTAMGVNFLATLVLAYVLAGIFALMDVKTVDTALKITLLIWLGFIAPTILNTVLFEGRSIKLYLINIGAQLFGMLVTAFVLIKWMW